MFIGEIQVKFPKDLKITVFKGGALQLYILFKNKHVDGGEGSMQAKYQTCGYGKKQQK